MSGATHDVKCMSCGAEVGRILFGRFEPNPNRRASTPRTGGLRRGGHCGGSLHLELTDDYPTVAALAERLRKIAADAAKPPRAS